MLKKPLFINCSSPFRLSYDLQKINMAIVWIPARGKAMAKASLVDQIEYAQMANAPHPPFPLICQAK